MLNMKLSPTTMALYLVMCVCLLAFIGATDPFDVHKGKALQPSAVYLEKNATNYCGCKRICKSLPKCTGLTAVKAEGGLNCSFSELENLDNFLEAKWGARTFLTKVGGGDSGASDSVTTTGGGETGSSNAGTTVGSGVTSDSAVATTVTLGNADGSGTTTTVGWNDPNAEVTTATVSSVAPDANGGNCQTREKEAWGGNVQARLDVTFTAAISISTTIVFTFDISLTELKDEHVKYDVTGSGTVFTWTPKGYHLGTVNAAIPYQEELWPWMVYEGATKPKIIAVTIDGVDACEGG